MMDNDFDNVAWDHGEPEESGGPSSSTDPDSFAGGAGLVAGYGFGIGADLALPPNVNVRDIDIGNALGDKLSCVVSAPIKEQDGTKDAFVSYLITTTSNFPSFQKPTFAVRRRFTDFVYLYNALVKEFLQSAVPPLPDKQRMEYVRGDRFGSEFTRRRARSLERFLVRISLHPQLRRAPILLEFLETHDWNLTMTKRDQRRSISSHDGSVVGISSVGSSGVVGVVGGAAGGAAGVFDAFADSVINVFTKVNKPDPRFIEIRENMDKMDEDLGNVEKVVARVVRRLGDLEADQLDLAEQFRKLIVMEPGIEPQVRRFATALDTTAKDLHAMRETTDIDYLGSVRDMSAYCTAVKTLLKTREQKQLDYEQLSEYLAKSSAEKEAMLSGTTAHTGAAGYAMGITGAIRSRIEDARGVDHETARRERLRKLEMRIELLGSESKEARLTAEAFNEEVLREVRGFERIKRVEFRGELLGVCEGNLKYFEGVEKVWEGFVRDMERDLEEGQTES